MSAEFIPIRIGTLRPGAFVTFDVYIRINQKHVFYVRNSDPFDSERLDRLRKKGLKKLFIKPEEEPNYLKYLDECLDQLADDSKSMTERGDVARDTMITEAENIERNLETEKGYRKVETRVGKVIEFLASDEGALSSVLKSAGVSVDNHQHSANVSTLSTALALQVGITNSRELYDLALASLVHDIGKVKLEIDFSLHREQMTPEQFENYKKHPQAAVDLLAAKKYITPGILRLVIDHEEVGDGKGFPERKRLSSMHVTSQVMNLCNDYDRFASSKQLAPLDAYDLFVQERGSLFKQDHIEALKEVISGKSE